MSSVLKKEEADKLVFKHHPKSFKYESSKVAKDFVSLQATTDSGFQIADAVAEQSGIDALRKQNIEAQIEETVLLRLKEIEEQAYKKAFDLGMIEGAEKAFQERHAELLQHLTRFDALCSEIDQIKIQLIKKNEAELMRFLHVLATKIAMREIKLNQEPILDMVAQVTADVQGAESVHVRLNASDFQFIEELRKRNVKGADQLKRFQFHEDPEVSIGGCVVETDFGMIDGTIEQRIEKAWQILELKLPSVKRVTS